MEILLTLIIAILIGVAYLLHSRSTEKQTQLDRLKEERDQLRERFAPVIDIDLEVDKLTGEMDALKASISETKTSYREKRALLERLINEAAIYDEEIKLAELGFYKPHFDFDTSEDYKTRITLNRDKQKQLVRDKTAIEATQEWHVDGSRAKGRTMTNRLVRLTARAFNNECSTAVANVRWNNVQRMEERVRKAFDAINKLNESNHIVISGRYLNLKIEEIRLTYEYHRKRQDEKEEQAEARRLLREEAKLQKEAEKALSEEQKYQRLLDTAHKEAEGASAAKLQALEGKISKLSEQLAEAHEKSERAKSMAEQTRSGHIYVISNIGSFGPGVYKIGMTRRLEPAERVKELGDASVPFIFDTHAMIYTQDAPSLEKALHNRFEPNRVNLVNSRKEFFRVNLDDIRDEVHKSFPDAQFIETVEARECNESLAIEDVAKQTVSAGDIISAKFPDEI